MQRLMMLLSAEFSVIANPNKFEKFDERGQKIK
jgi:hypothetical protein